VAEPPARYGSPLPSNEVEEPRPRAPRPRPVDGPRRSKRPRPPAPSIRPTAAERRRDRQPPRRRSSRGKRNRGLARLIILLVLILAVVGFGVRAIVGGEDTPPEARAGAGANVENAAPETAERPAEQTSASGTYTIRPMPSYAPGARDVTFAPGLSAGSYVALDATSNRILISNADRQKRPFASLTKIMTVWLLSEAGEPEREVPVSEVAAGVEPNKDGLIIGNTYPRETLLYSAMLGSNNDAAAALGEDLGGSFAGFYKLMNERAQEMGLTDTTYASASGLDDTTNISSARDQAVVLATAVQNEKFRRVSGTTQHSVTWPDDGSTRIYDNHNRMLSTSPGVFSGKTGFTTAAGGCLAVAARRDGITIVAVILGSGDIWGDMPRLIDEAFARAKANQA
jgi:D-alanyl-D-alanine carboxypeptidase